MHHLSLPYNRFYYVPTLQMRRLWLKEFKQLVQGHPARRWRSKDCSEAYVRVMERRQC